MDTREKEFNMAMRQLTPIFVRKLPAKDVSHDLYGNNQLTLNEYKLIGKVDGGISQFVFTHTSVLPWPIMSAS